MKLVLINLILLLISVSACEQADVEEGLVSINFDANTVLHFYESPDDKQQPVKSLQFFDDKTINSWIIKDINKHQEWLNPEVLWLDYSSFVFRSKATKGGWFEVVVNNETGKSYWLKKNEWTKYLTWQDFLENMFSISRIPGHPQHIRKSPSDNAEQIKYSGQDCFQIKTMRGDWIEIFTPEHCDEEYTETETKIKSGWIKWRQGDEILIVYYITS